jgi:hypothetical protein
MEQNNNNKINLEKYFKRLEKQYEEENKNKNIIRLFN